MSKKNIHGKPYKITIHAELEMIKDGITESDIDVIRDYGSVISQKKA